MALISSESKFTVKETGELLKQWPRPPREYILREQSQNNTREHWTYILNRPAAEEACSGSSRDLTFGLIPPHRPGAVDVIGTTGGYTKPVELATPHGPPTVECGVLAMAASEVVHVSGYGQTGREKE